MPDRRSFVFRQFVHGRHESFTQALEGEYIFSVDHGPSSLEVYNAATDELQQVIKRSLADGRSLRARGALWSLSKVAVNNARLIDTTALRSIFDVGSNRVEAGYTGDPAHLRFVECGTSVGALNTVLFDSNLSLRVSGANNGQTLAGAIGTGTHGAGFEVGAIHDTVVGLHMVLGPDKHVYLQRANPKVMKDEFAGLLGATPLADDDLFNSALVSFGSFGVIHGLMIETRPLFVLHALRFYHLFDDGIRKAIDDLDFSEIQIPADLADGVPLDRPYHFELITNPNEEGNPPNEVCVLLMFEGPYDVATYQVPQWDDGAAGPAAGAIDRMGRLLEIVPSILNPIMKSVLNGQMRDEYPRGRESGIVRDLFRGEKLIGKALATAVAVRADQARTALKIMYDTYHDHGEVLPVLISMRRVKGSDAILGFTKYAATAVLEIDGVNNESCRKFVRQAWNAMEANGIDFTVHWGKWNEWLTADRIRKAYDQNSEDRTGRWIASRKQLLDDPNVRRMFENDFLRNLSLAT